LAAVCPDSEFCDDAVAAALPTILVVVAAAAATFAKAGSAAWPADAMEDAAQVMAAAATTTAMAFFLPRAMRGRRKVPRVVVLALSDLAMDFALAVPRSNNSTGVHRA
jgi:uncharacterized membrane protein YozB (DUF420 family)